MEQGYDANEVFAALDTSANVTYVLSVDLRIQRWNDAWNVFARDNGGAEWLARWKPDTSLLDVIPEVLRPFYTDGYAAAARDQKRWDHDYECSSPGLYRRFRMVTYPCGNAFVVTHALLVEAPHAGGGTPYDAGALITMCCHCRRACRVNGTKEHWDWIPAYVETPPSNVTHGLCGACSRYYYGPAVQ